MSKLLIKLRHAPDDEIQEIHSLLQEHHIDFYETQFGPWGISAPGIWVNDDDQYDRANPTSAIQRRWQPNPLTRGMRTGKGRHYRQTSARWLSAVAEILGGGCGGSSRRS